MSIAIDKWSKYKYLFTGLSNPGNTNKLLYLNNSDYEDKIWQVNRKIKQVYIIVVEMIVICN